MSNNTFAAALRRHMDAQGLTQTAVAEMTGVAQPVIGRLLAMAQPEMPTLLKIARGLEVEIRIAPDGAVSMHGKEQGMERVAKPGPNASDAEWDAYEKWYMAQDFDGSIAEWEDLIRRAEALLGPRETWPELIKKNNGG